MAAIKPVQIKSIYALGSSLGIKGSGHDDELHILIQGITGKSSIKELSCNEGEAVLMELRERMKLGRLQNKRDIPKPKTHDAIAGGVTAEQQKKCWALMYELKKFDIEPNYTSLGERLCGIIKRQFGVTGFVKQPFRFLNFEQGRELIEFLKQYATTAELKYLHRPQNGVL